MTGIQALQKWTAEDDEKLLAIRLSDENWVDTAMQRFRMTRRQVEYRVTAIRHRMVKDGQPLPEGLEVPMTKAARNDARNALWEGKIETLKQMWLDGFSASQIAVKLGDGITRNAVIGKINRLHLNRSSNRSKAKLAAVPDHHAPKPPKPVKRGAPVKPVLRVAVPAPEIDHEDGVDVTHLVGIMQLDKNTCRWPIGDPLTKEFGFCGCQVAEGSVYCAPHRKRAHAPKFAEA